MSAAARPTPPSGPAPARADVHAALAAPARWRAGEALLLAALVAAWFVLPGKALLGREIAILALFAVSLDLVLGYAGIVSLGHAAYFGTGAYAAALFAKHVLPDPLLGLAFATVVSALLGLVTSPLILRGSDLTRLMVTLGVASLLYELANKLDAWTGGADGLQGVVIGPLLGRFEFDLAGRVGFAYALVVLVLALLACRRLVHSPFGVSLQALRDNRLRAAALGVDVPSRLVAVMTLAGGLAGAAGALLAQTTGFVSLDVLDFHRSADVLLMLVVGGTGWLWGGVLGATAFKLLQDVLAGWSPQYWTFWLGLFLVVLVLVGRERLLKPWTWWRA